MPATTVRGAGWLCLSLVLCLAWAMTLRFSGLFFEKTPTAMSSNTVATCAVAALTLGASLAARLRVRTGAVRGRTVLAAASALAATAASVLALFAPVPAGEVGAAVRLVAAGLLVGAAFVGCGCLAVWTYKRLAFATALSIAAAGFAAAYAFFLLISAVYPVAGPVGRTALSCLVGALPVLSAACFVRQGGLAGPGRSATPELLLRFAADGSGSRKLFYVMLALVGFLVVFMPTMYPKTTNCAPAELGAHACLGLASLRSVVALALCCVALWGAAVFAGRSGKSGSVNKSTALTIVAFVVIAVFASVFFSLPTMSSSPVPFVLITFCSMLLTLAVLAVLVHQDWRVMRRGLVVMAAAGLAASVFSLVFLGPLYGLSVYQDALFSAIPAVLLVFVVFVGFCLWGRMARPAATPGKASPDADPLLARCESLSSRCGLTKREAQVLELLAAGRNEPYIEEALGVSRATVKTHITHIYRKVGVSSRQQLLDALQGEAR